MHACLCHTHWLGRDDQTRYLGPPIAPSLRIGDLETGAALPYGREGEVMLRGPGVMPGYLCREKVQDFVDGEWLRTGDLGRMDHWRVGKYRRYKMGEVLGTKPMDTAAMNSLSGTRLDALKTVSAAKPSSALLGMRFFLILWVV